MFLSPVQVSELKVKKSSQPLFNDLKTKKTAMNAKSMKRRFLLRIVQLEMTVHGWPMQLDDREWLLLRGFMGAKKSSFRRWLGHDDEKEGS